MQRTPRQPCLERRRLAELRPYPRQTEFFYDVNDEVLQGIARAAADGRLPPPEVLDENRAGLPRGTTLKGHQRLRAYELNGATEVEVLVRHDLADADLPTIELEFLTDNVFRRDLDALTKARAALRVYELMKGRRGCLAPHQEAAAREHVGRMVGWSGRTLQRYANLLRTPLEVQDAVRAGRLRLVVAERVAWLDEAAKAEIGRRIGGGEDPKVVVASFVASKGRQRNAGDPVAFLVRGLKRALRHVEGRIDELPPHRLRISVPCLLEAQRVLAALIARAAQGSEGGQ